MIGLHPDCPPGVSLLADHLDCALATGEDLLAATLAARSDLDDTDPEGAPEAFDRFVGHLARLEASFLLRVLQVRRHLALIARADATLKAAVTLFKAQTGILNDLIQVGETDGGLSLRGDAHAYLRSRGLLPAEAAAPSPFECICVTETFRIGGVAPLGLMLDLVSSLLDLLDARYGLYAPDAEVSESAQEPGQAGSDRATPESPGSAVTPTILEGTATVLAAPPVPDVAEGVGSSDNEAGASTGQTETVR